jgi:hypothetical protein
LTERVEGLMTYIVVPAGERVDADDGVFPMVPRMLS